MCDRPPGLSPADVRGAEGDARKRVLPLNNPLYTREIPQLPEVRMNRLRRRTVLNWAAALGAPALLRGRFQLFADSPEQIPDAEYSARAIRLVTESTVVDLLN